jgi:putative transposase
MVEFHAWVFMTNHVHLLVTPATANSVSKMMQALGQFYVRYFNYTYQRSGTLWEGRYKSCVVYAKNYLLICQRYIELNPVRARIVDSPADYYWSSYQTKGSGEHQPSAHQIPYTSHLATIHLPDCSHIANYSRHTSMMT